MTMANGEKSRKVIMFPANRERKRMADSALATCLHQRPVGFHLQIIIVEHFRIPFAGKLGPGAEWEANCAHCNY